MTHHVIYIPGLGDTDRGIHKQAFAVGLWRFWGVHPHLFQMNWADDQPFGPKLERLLILIDDCAKEGAVSLVGASAGATAVINAYAARWQTVSGVVCIAGKINNPHAISGGYQRKHPSFHESAQQTIASLAKLGPSDRRHILSIRASIDGYVPARDSILEGARNRTSWISGHGALIANQITVGAPFWLRFLKRQAAGQITTKS